MIRGRSGADAETMKLPYEVSRVLSLYPGNEGYSLMIRGRSGADAETMKLPYEESEFLDYVDNEELPPILVDLLEKAQANLFYNGCVIVEVRDYRRSTNGSFDSKHVLLKPTSESLLCDINSITRDGYRWTQEDKFTLESQLILATEEPLCLDPSVAVSLVANRLQYESRKFNTRSLKRSAKKFSQIAVNRKMKMLRSAAPKHLRLHDFILKRKDKARTHPPVNLKVGKTCVDMWRQRNVHLTPPENIEIEQYAKALERPKATIDFTPVMVEEFILEAERTQGKVSYTRLVIQQRLSDDFHSGELYVDRDYVEGVLRGSTCRFPLGPRENADKYIQQFTEIFTEEGRRPVKITHMVPGQSPQVSFTPPAVTSSTPQVNLNPSAQALLTQAANLTASLAGQVDMNNAGKKAQPIKLSLSLSSNVGFSPQTTPAQSPSGSLTPQAQLSINIQPPQQLVQKGRGGSVYGHMARSVEPPSPVTTPTTPGQLPTYSQATSAPVTNQATTKMSNPPPTPPPLVRTPSMGSGISRRASAEAMKAMQQGILSGQVQGQPSVATTMPSTSDRAMQGSLAPPNINIANIASMPQNINIPNLTSLQQMGLTNFQGLQNLQNIQVSLTGVSVPGGIAVPVPISMINTSNPSMNTPASIIINSLPGVMTTSTSASTTNTSMSTTQGQGTSSQAPTFVTMVTANPSTSSTANTTTVSSASGVLTSQAGSSIVAATPSGMVSVPINMAQNMAQWLKTTSQGIRAGATPLSLLQIPGQQPIQLLNAANLQQQRGQLGQTSQASGSQAARPAGTPSPVSTATALQNQPVTLFSQMHSGKGQGQPTTLTQQQLMQFTAPSLAQTQAAQLALQKQGRSLSSKSKSRKKSN
ncbi:transcription factor SPT20 homolog isoform X1 [Lineus longissimus]|uniref:transcription factor SPT20 homolog isoform X1 n=1 Tax=Lineus longissimus TaxID=88925 RepID=UPI00315CB6E7